MVPDEAYARILDVDWDREKLRAAALSVEGLVEQSESEQRPHKISFEASSASPDALVARLRAALDATGLAFNLVYSAGKDVDILPKRASKGEGLRVLHSELAEDPASALLLAERTLVCGDSGNDVELIAVDNVRACIVANSKPELRQWCAF